MIYNIGEKVEGDVLLRVAERMAVAARTAPKAKGIDNIFISIITDDTIKELSAEMIRIGNETGQAFFVRDAENILNAGAILLLGTKIQTLGLKQCDYCGFESCVDKSSNAKIPCAFNNIDLGIAIGSAVSVAADNRVDNRVMFSVGYAAKELKIIDI